MGGWRRHKSDMKACPSFYDPHHLSEITELAARGKGVPPYHHSQFWWKLWEELKFVDGLDEELLPGIWEFEEQYREGGQIVRITVMRNSY